MRLLLVFLLSSELSLPGEETWVLDDFCRILFRKLLLSRLKSPGKDLELVLTRNEDACVCFQRDCVLVAGSLRQRSSSFHWGCSLHDEDANQDTAGLIPNNRFPALAIASFCGAGKRIPVFLVKSSSLTASLRRHFSAFLLEKIPDMYLLTKSCCTTATAIISHGKIRIKKTLVQVVAEPTEKETPAMLIKAPLQIEIQRHAVRRTKRNKYLQQLSGKVALKVADAVSVRRQLLLVSRVKEGSINTSAQDDKTEQKKSRKHAELRYLQEQRKTDKNETPKILAQQKQNVHKTNDEDVDEGHMLSDAGEQALIMLLLPQRKPLNERKPDLKPAVKPETVRITLKEVGDPPSINKTLQAFITGADTSKYERFSARKHSLQLHETERTEIMELKPAEKTENRETDVNKASINTHNPAEDLILPSSPSVKVRPAETTTTAYSTGSTHTTNTEAFSQDDPRGQQNQTTTTGPEPETKTETRITKGKPETTQVTPETVFSGFRMREDIRDVLTKFHKDTENRDRASTNRIRTDNQNEPRPKSPFERSGAFREETMNPSQTTGPPGPVCRGLIHRTESGWRHCTERLGRAPASLVSTQEAPDVRETENTPVSNKPPFSDEDHHFYYFNGVLKKVPNPFYVYSKRFKRRRRSSGDRMETLRKI